MMDEDFVERRPADLEIYRRLDAFAQVRLAPDAAAMARIRTALMGQALALADARSAALTSPAPLPVALPGDQRSRSRARSAAPRPPFSLHVSSSGSVPGASPRHRPAGRCTGRACGSKQRPCPAIRWRARMPSSNGSMRGSRRCASQPANGNAGAAEAALEAYAVIAADLDAQAATNSAVAASLEDGMALRQLVLIGLLDEVPAQAQDAIQHALQQGANAIDGNDDPHPGNPAQGGGGQGGQSQGGSGRRSGRQRAGRQWLRPGRRWAG